MTVGEIGGLATATIAVIGAVYALAVFVFAPRLRDVIETALEPLSAELKLIKSDMERRHADTEARLASGSERMTGFNTRLESIETRVRDQERLVSQLVGEVRSR